MERKTQIHAEDNKQEILITRDFDLPLDLLFRAYTDPEIVEQWMGTRVRKLENRMAGGWAFETSDPQGNILFKAHGVIHEFTPEQKIIRTFQMDGAGFDAQLEFLDFESLSEETSRLTMRTIYKSVAHRDQVLRMPFAYGLNMAHNRLQEVVGKLVKSH
jgi:uncharacterized protein YndB with AHSA1/START domain